MKSSWIRAGLTLAITTLALSAIGFGGLAGWSVSTPNAATVFAGGSMVLSDSVGANTCTATLSSTPATGCAVIFSSANIPLGPGDSAPGTVTITNNGTLPADIELTETATPSPSTSSICSELDLTINGDAGPTNYTPTPTTLAAFASTTGVALSTPLAASGGSDTYNFDVSMNAAAPSSDSGQSCTAAFTFTATNA